MDLRRTRGWWYLGLRTSFSSSFCDVLLVCLVFLWMVCHRLQTDLDRSDVVHLAGVVCSPQEAVWFSYRSWTRTPGMTLKE